MTVGVLALQGDFAEHIRVLSSIGVRSLEVRSVEDLTKADRLILPGGESTVMAKLLFQSGLGQAISDRFSRGELPIYATCAGAILVSREVQDGSVSTLGLLDITTQRNAYGRQSHSFRTALSVRGIQTPVQASFIRAPHITRVGEGVSVLANYDESPVLVQARNIIAGTFHTEVTGDPSVHKLFVV